MPSTGTDDLADRLRAAVGAFVRAGRGRPGAMPEHRAQTLGFLMREGPLTVAELADRRQVRHQTLQATIPDLEAEGLVRREPDPRDQRARLVVLTDGGLATLRLELDRRAGLIAAAIEHHLDADQRAVLEQVPDLLHRLAGGLMPE
ncbi:MarR family winged helix-turn-helix transcriptional regulator [Nakamurella alba]|nr:MarR family transcriptional regulator [Nakamurella alba]